MSHARTLSRKKKLGRFFSCHWVSLVEEYNVFYYDYAFNFGVDGIWVDFSTLYTINNNDNHFDSLSSECWIILHFNLFAANIICSSKYVFFSVENCFFLFASSPYSSNVSVDSNDYYIEHSNSNNNWRYNYYLFNLENCRIKSWFEMMLTIMHENIKLRNNYYSLAYNRRTKHGPEPLFFRGGKVIVDHANFRWLIKLSKWK